jgi:DNA-binding XRE family transcriptional regulator
LFAGIRIFFGPNRTWSPDELPFDGNPLRFLTMPAGEKLLSGEVEMPSLPEADSNGDRPALPFMRAIIARGIIRDRAAAGLSQAELARRGEVEPATLNRIEKATATPDQAAITKIDKALKDAAPKLDA